MITRAFIHTLFEASYIHRWNDKLRPIEFIEMDKHAHRAIIAYLVGSFERDTPSFSWQALIEGILFELLQKIVLTDIKSPVFYMIKEDREKYRRLNEFVFEKLRDVLKGFGEPFCQRFQDFFSETDNTLEKRILTTSSVYASQWEFAIIRASDPHSYENTEIDASLSHKLEQYADLKGLSEILRHKDYEHFVSRCGELRYQTRWAGVHRIPATSVLNHSLFVAIFSYLFSLEVGACPKRCYNNFFTGLFHDLPEVLTRDIISPIKRSVEGLRDLLIEYERAQMERIIYPLLPLQCANDMHFFTENEKQGIVTIDGQMRFVSSNEINEQYNDDRFNPRDGEFVKLADELAAFVESEEAIRNGCQSSRFISARDDVRAIYAAHPSIGGIDTASFFC